VTATRFKSGSQSALQSPVLAVEAALALRMLLIWWIHRDHDAHAYLFFPSSYENWNVAWSMVHGNGFSEAIRGASGPTALVAPGYPWLIAFALKIFQLDDYYATLLCLTVNSLMSALTCWPIYQIGKKIGNREIGLVSSWLWVFLPTAIIFPLEWLWDTSFSAFFVALLIWWTLELPANRSALNWAGYGLVWGAALLMSPAVGILLPFLLLWAVVRCWRDRLPLISQAGATVLACLLCLAPWTARNYAKFGKLIPVRGSFGLDFWLGNNSSVKGNWNPARHPIGDPAEMRQLVQLGEVRYVQLKQQEAVEFITAHPRAFLYQSLVRLADTWTGLADVPADRWVNALHAGRAYIGVMSAFSLLAFGGFILTWRSFGWDAAPVWIAPIVFPLTYYVTHASLRHRHPVDPVLAIFAVCAVAQARSLLSRRVPTESQPSAIQAQ
jgi:hypothetical protein